MIVPPAMILLEQRLVLMPKKVSSPWSLLGGVYKSVLDSDEDVNEAPPCGHFREMKRMEDSSIHG